MRTLITLPDDRQEPARQQMGWERAHRTLAEWNSRRWKPGVPTADWRAEIAEDASMRLLEGELVEQARAEVQAHAARAPRDPDGFVGWFEDLEHTGPGQHDALFDWIADSATLDDLRWFLEQEISGEAGFDDLVAHTQVQMPVQAKLELARNYWDEMGRGDARAMHGPLLQRLADELGVAGNFRTALTAPLALSNVMSAMAANRRYAYHSIGALGAIELTAPARAAKVTAALKRLNVRPKARQYFAVHATLDVRHSEAWNREVLHPLVAGNPDCAVAIAEGALIRLTCGAHCFDAYKAHLWGDRTPAMRRAS